MSEYLENVRVPNHNNTLIFMLVRDIFNVDLIICEYRKQKFIIVFVWFPVYNLQYLHTNFVIVSFLKLHNV